MMRRSWIEVSRGAIASNYDAVAALVGPRVEVAPVVKADAYRHGAVEVARILAGRGAKWLCVSSVAEGAALRAAGLDPQVLVMADSLPTSLRRAVELRLTPVLHGLEEIAILERICASMERAASFHLKIDSGMGRLGTGATAAEILGATRDLQWTRLEGLMTHFASAADYSSGQTEDQTGCFNAIATVVNPPLRHASSTTAIAYGRREAWHELVRPGHAIYGYVSPVRSGPPCLLEVKPALCWKAAVLLVKEVPQGARIGYGAQFTAPRPMRIGIIAAGYADGIPHRLSNRGRMIAGGQFAPILGAVSMDVTTIDLSAAPGVRAGDPVTIIGGEGGCSQDAQQLARAAGTISYAVLCGISARVERVYV
ncbi:MAG: alanine racemase [Acidobacteria bacterium]|nr:alanine racemase [Acidobacteriota bacterium]